MIKKMYVNIHTHNNFTESIKLTQPSLERQTSVYMMSHNLCCVSEGPGTFYSCFKSSAEMGDPAGRKTISTQSELYGSVVRWKLLGSVSLQ